MSVGWLLRDFFFSIKCLRRFDETPAQEQQPVEPEISLSRVHRISEHVVAGWLAADLSAVQTVGCSQLTGRAFIVASSDQCRSRIPLPSSVRCDEKKLPTVVSLLLLLWTLTGVETGGFQRAGDEGRGRAGRSIIAAFPTSAFLFPALSAFLSAN